MAVANKQVTLATTLFENLICSLLSLVPKNQPGTFRLIHYLYFPARNSVHAQIQSYERTVHYPTEDDAITDIKGFGPNTNLAKVDIRDAHRIIPIYPKE